MPLDNLQFPPRFVGYGAYNLCFDRQLGVGQGHSENFFQFLRSKRPNGQLKWPAVNLVKVICFRKSNIEGLPAPHYDSHGKADKRTQPLFNLDKTINEGFLNNLLALVKAAKAANCWVQICLFSYHSIAIKWNEPQRDETPENAPGLLAPRVISKEPKNYERLTQFFSLDNPARVNLQKQIVRRIAGKLRMETNVLFEIANELRIQGGDAAMNKAGNCQLLPWLNAMSEEVLSAIFWDYAPDGTSTGVGNEAVTFTATRPFQGCGNARLRSTFYDFHSGQWGASDDHAAVSAAIGAAKARVLGYQASPPGDRAFLILNDDGENWDEDLADESPNVPEMKRNAARIKSWADIAFQQGLHYSSKQQYPPGRNYDTYALNALQQAAELHPLP